MYTNSMWAPCSGCPCQNHNLPSCTFTVEPSLSDDPEWIHLTRSNNPPSQYEEMVLSTIISAYDEQIQGIELERSNLEAFSLSLKAQIVAVSQKMDALRQERARITEAVHERRNLLSPVRRLPSEILNHIFLDTVDFPVPRIQKVEEENERGSWEFKPTESSLGSITRVSTKWRSASLSSPRLWSYVNIAVTESNFKGHSYIRQLGRQLDCSTNYPLSISICSIVKEHPPQDLPPQLVAILFSFSSRIRELHLYLTTSIFSQMSGMQLSLPSLESLILLCQDGVSGIFENLRLFSYTPKLQSLEVIDWRDGLELPWSQLKKYHSDHRYISTDFHGPQTHHHLNALRKLQQAEECALRLSGTSLAREFGDDLYPLICPRLRVLDLSSWSTRRAQGTQSVFRQVADKLVLPALSVLRVSCSQRGNYEMQETFVSICHLLQRSQSPITVLHFDNGLVLTEDLLHLFPSAPTLKDLRLSRIGSTAFTREVIEKLTVDPTSASEDLILPHLCNLYIPGGTFRFLDLVNMVHSRRSSDDSRRVDRLQTLRLCGNFAEPNPGLDFTHSRLKQYYAEGFSFGIYRIVG